MSKHLLAALMILVPLVMLVAGLHLSCVVAYPVSALSAGIPAAWKFLR